MEPKQPIGPLSGLLLIGVGSLILLATLNYEGGAGQRAQRANGGEAVAQAQTWRNLPPIPFGR